MRDMIDTGSLECPACATVEAIDAVGVEPIGRDPAQPILWRRFGFDHGGICYGFETSKRGDRSRVVVNGTTALELPRAVWTALLEAACLQRGADAASPIERGAECDARPAAASRPRVPPGPVPNRSEDTGPSPVGPPSDAPSARAAAVTRRHHGVSTSSASPSTEARSMSSPSNPSRC